MPTDVHNEIGDIHARLEALKHLGVKATYNTSAGTFYTYSCTVYVQNYVSYLNSTKRNFDQTVSWNAGEGNLKAALKKIAGDEKYWRIWYTVPGTENEYRSFFGLQTQVERDIANPETRNRVRLHVSFAG
jgi:hypothetical protein